MRAETLARLLRASIGRAGQPTRQAILDRMIQVEPKMRSSTQTAPILNHDYVHRALAAVREDPHRFGFTVPYVSADNDRRYIVVPVDPDARDHFTDKEIHELDGGMLRTVSYVATTLARMAMQIQLRMLFTRSDLAKRWLKNLHRKVAFLADETEEALERINERRNGTSG